ncbi:hypothetical protein I2I05_10775 [Hymenobacter sp. BT683]|uniref:Uncharacterized protein n=1 Tax=Hymenobacter jeongseonensis TaxID=2791027 RepID=A0ABS0IHP0_9BACT|nr:hypothetical protein [Hymenobacter jeongseonensis]MBF9237877.1 hypothetical protein [Hymenobacter jeongseonensis]
MLHNPFRSAKMPWLLAPALATGLLLSSCNSQPTATEVDKTATVVPSETNEASDSTATTVATDSTGAATTAP